jgi:hypothetical protein
LIARWQADLAYSWTTARNVYPSTPVGDAAELSAAMLKKYAVYFDDHC